MKRLWQNKGGYLGETIQIEGIVRECRETALKLGWTIESLPVEAGLEIHTLTHRTTDEAPRVYISAGIHGDEPAGPLAVRRLLMEYRLPASLNYWIIPCLNPAGFGRNRRENLAGLDLNRDYRHLESAEIKAHIDWLKRQPSFDLCLCLHEDWESHGFYIYELNPDHLPTLAERMIEAAKPVCPIDESVVIEGRPARAGIIRPDLDPNSRPQWPESFYLINFKTRQSYTLEAPSDFPLATRVDALVEAVGAALKAFVSSE